MSYNFLKVGKRANQVTIRHGVDSDTPASATAIEVPVYVDERSSLSNGNAVVVSATFVPSTTLASGVNNPTITINKRTAGGAAVVLASVSLTGTSLTAFKPQALTLTATTANLTLAPADAITFQITTNGAGAVTLPVGYITVDIDRT